MARCSSTAGAEEGKGNETGIDARAKEDRAQELLLDAVAVR